MIELGVHVLAGLSVDRVRALALHAPHGLLVFAGVKPSELAPLLRRKGFAEGLHWLLQQPDVLERDRCVMTIGSRVRRTDGSFDARTPAIWISNGTGRDGRERKNAPKVGWCWAGNRHTWLEFASAEGRTALSG